MPSEIRLHHDTELHECTERQCGPVVPVAHCRPHEAPEPRHVKCAACGTDWIETDPAKLARYWWSRGACGSVDRRGATATGGRGVSWRGVGWAPTMLWLCYAAEKAARDHVVLLYDRERYGGETWAPGYERGMIRWALNAYSRRPGSHFSDLIWAATAPTYEAIRSMVPPGGAYFDRSRNYPSPMVPIEGWYFAAEPPSPYVDEIRAGVAG